MNKLTNKDMRSIMYLVKRGVLKLLVTPTPQQSKGGGDE